MARKSYGFAPSSSRRSGSYGFAPSNPFKKDEEDEEDQNPLETTNKTIGNYQERMASVGVQAPERKVPGLANFGMSVLNTIDKPRNIVASALAEVLSKDKYRGNVWDAVKEGATGKRHVYGSDIVKNMGWTGDSLGHKIGRGVVGFAADVALDPLTYVSMGGSVAGKAVAREGLEAAMKKGGREMAESAARKPGYVKAKDFNFNGLKGKKADDTLKEIFEQHGHLVPEQAKRFSERGLKGLNADDMRLVQDVVRGAYQNAHLERKAANKSFAQSSKSLMNPLTNKEAGEFHLGRLSADQRTKLLDGLHEVETGVNAGAPNWERRLQTLLDLGADSRLTPKYLEKTSKKKLQERVQKQDNLAFDVYERLHDVYKPGSAEEKKALYGIAKRLQDTLMSPDKGASGGGLFRDMSKMTGFGAKLSEAERKALALEQQARFMTGVNNTYRDYNQNRKFLKVMGKEVADVTDVMKPVSKAVNGIIDKTPYAGRVANMLGGIFNTQHIDRGIRAENGGKGYQALKEHFVPLVNRFSAEESSIPAEAIKKATAMFSGEMGDRFFKDQAVRNAVPYFIEGVMHPKPHEAAVKEWDKIAQTLTPEQLDMVKWAGGLVGESHKSMALMDKEILGAMKKEGFDPNAGYVLHAYKPKNLGDDYHGKFAENFRSAMMDPNLDASKASSYKERTYQSLAHAKEAGEIPVEDIVQLMAMRHATTGRATLNNRFRQELLETLQAQPALGKYMGQGTRKVETKTLKSGKEVEKEIFDSGISRPSTFVNAYGIHVDNRLSNQFNRIARVQNPVDSEASFLNMWDKGTNLMKSLQTNVNPSFVAKNAVGETIQAVRSIDGNPLQRTIGVAQRLGKIFDARRVLDHADANRFQLGANELYDNGQLVMRRSNNGGVVYGPGYNEAMATAAKHGSPMLETARSPVHETSATRNTDFQRQAVEAMKERGVKTRTLDGREYTIPELVSMAHQHGLFQHGISKGNFEESVAQEVSRELGQKHGTVGQRLAGTMPRMADDVESSTRFGHFMDLLDKGHDAETAAKLVKRSHVDYKDLTVTERNVLRRVAPYYTFMRKNTPMQFRGLVENPGSVNAIMQPIRQTQQAAEDRGEVMPDYLKESMAMPLGQDAKGNNRYLNMNLPLTDLTRLRYDAGEGMDKNVLQMLHPAIKAPFELGMNQNLSYGAPIEKYGGQTAPLISGLDNGVNIPKKADYAIQQLGLVENLRKALGATSNAVQGKYNPDRPQDSDLATMLTLQSILPVRNQNAVELQQAYDYRDQLQQYAKMLKDEYGVELPRAEQDRKKKYKLPKFKFTP